MTNRLADAYDKAAEAYEALAEAVATVALELRAYADGGGMPPERPPVFGGTPTPGAPSLAELPLDPWDEPEPEVLPAYAGQVAPAGSAAVCPAHNIEYRDGRYGKFCPSQGTDPKWTNERGYCTVTPKNAAAYLRQKAQR